MATGPAAFTVAMQALGSLYFLDNLRGTHAVPHFGDTAGCLTDEYQQHDLAALTLRHLRCAATFLLIHHCMPCFVQNWCQVCSTCQCHDIAAHHDGELLMSRAFYRHAGHSLASTIVKAEGLGAFEMLTGVGDETSFHALPFPSWESDVSDTDKCYWANYEQPAADVAAMTAMALALVAKVLHEHALHHDSMLDDVVKLFTEKATHAFEYALDTYLEYGRNASCTNSPASSFCIGSCFHDVRGVRACSPWPCLVNVLNPNTGKLQGLFMAH